MAVFVIRKVIAVGGSGGVRLSQPPTFFSYSGDWSATDAKKARLFGNVEKDRMPPIADEWELVAGWDDKDVEIAIARCLIESGLRKGYRFSVFDGEEYCLKGSGDVETILGAMRSTDADRLHAETQHGAPIAWVSFVYGNEPWAVMADSWGGRMHDEWVIEADALAVAFEEVFGS